MPLKKGLQTPEPGGGGGLPNSRGERSLWSRPGPCPPQGAASQVTAQGPLSAEDSAVSAAAAVSSRSRHDSMVGKPDNTQGAVHSPMGETNRHKQHAGMSTACDGGWARHPHDRCFVLLLHSFLLCDNQDILVPPYLFSFLSCGRCLKELEILKSSKDGKNEISNVIGAKT